MKVLTRRTIKTKVEVIDKTQIITTNMRYLPPHSKSSALDSDVSDIAIGFYERIYNVNEIKNSDGNSAFPNSKLLECRRAVNWEFIGDTMNTAYKDINYHCLANFWLIPGQIGRTFGKYSRASKYRDKLDAFLSSLNNGYYDYSEVFSVYFSHFNSFDVFIEKHFLRSYVECKEGEKVIKTLSCPKDVEKMITLRAYEIAQEKYEVLYNYFSENLEPLNNV